jgi:hypothetical protein
LVRQNSEKTTISPQTLELKDEYKSTPDNHLKGIKFTQNNPLEKISNDNRWVYFFDENTNSNIYGFIKNFEEISGLYDIHHAIIHEQTTENNLVLKMCNGCSLSTISHIGICKIRAFHMNVFQLPISSKNKFLTYTHNCKIKEFIDVQLRDIQLHLKYFKYFK